MREHTAEVTAAQVTAAEIARLAGVGRAAVSNWRRRHSDFPQPRGGTETSPTFALRDVEAWLHAQGKISEVSAADRAWQRLELHRDEAGGLPAALIAAGESLLDGLRDPGRTVHNTGPAAAVNTFAAEVGAATAFEQLLGRYTDAKSQRGFITTPAPLAGLMGDLAGAAVDRPESVLDPAAGVGTLLLAFPAAATHHGQELDPDLAHLARLRAALRAFSTGPAPSPSPSPVTEIRAGDALLADAFPGLEADVVLSHPPFNVPWPHEELAYDPRWEYGLPPRTEGELAWVQHALTHLRPGGTAVLVMPPAAASRRSGRRIRAELLRRGALRAVVALPAGTAAPYGIPLYLWVLRRPEPTGPPPADVLMIDTEAVVGERFDGDWGVLGATVLTPWLAYLSGQEAGQGVGQGAGQDAVQPGVAAVVPVVDLLDDEVDLTPAHNHPAPTGADAAEQLQETVRRTRAAIAELGAFTPPPAQAADPARHRPATTVGDLIRAGALTVPASGDRPAADARVLTEQDVLNGDAPSGTPGPDEADKPVLLAAGDVVLPVSVRTPVARVVGLEADGAVLGRGLQALRPDASAVDPDFLAGFLRSTTAHRNAGSRTSTVLRLDARRVQLPRLPLAEQQRYGGLFRQLADFEAVLRTVAEAGTSLVQGLTDALADGSLEPQPDTD